MLLPLPVRMQYLHDAGAEYCGLINFNAEFAALSADDFLENLINTPEFELAAVCVGKNWRFGYKGSGNTEKIAGFCRKHHIAFSAVPELTIAGKTASSSLIREQIAAGDLKGAEAMLNRHVQLFGTVVHGNQVAGSILKTPTANLQLSAGVLPPDGVYAGSVKLDDQWFRAAVNIGFSPTFSVGVRRVEIHLLDCQCDLYDREITLQLHQFIRKEQHFDSADELKMQIASDLKIIRSVNIPV
jgi:riboflavin kinase/FMN adenylyltransferase